MSDSDTHEPSRSIDRFRSCGPGEPDRRREQLPVPQVVRIRTDRGHYGGDDLVRIEIRSASVQDVPSRVQMPDALLRLSSSYQLYDRFRPVTLARPLRGQAFRFARGTES